MCKRTILSLLIAMCFSVAWAAEKRFTLVIDPGHGGHDTGALGTYSKEKNINLNVALAFGRYVERNCPDVKVIYTRKTDVFVTLHERANIANRNKADLFVSVHTNALPKGKIARGLETYTLGMHRASDNFDVAKRENSVILIEKDYKQHYEGFDPRSSESYIMFEFMQDRNMAQSVDMARYVQQRTCAAAGRPNKGVKQAGFLVLRETSMPSCLIELGFITTPEEERFLNTENGIDALGRGIYNAFLDYRKKYDKSITVPYMSEAQKKAAEAEEDKKEEKKKSKSKKKNTDAENIVAELRDARGGRLSDDLRTAAGRDERAEARKNDAGQNSTVASGQYTGNTKQQANGVKQAAGTTGKQDNAVHEIRIRTTEQSTDEPIFKVQILASNRNLRPDSQQFKGAENIDCYEENGMYKYTCGASADYNAIYRLRKELVEKFPEAFIIAFKGGKKVNVVEAIREFKQNRNKKQTL